jgi:hypothetical protein
MDHSHMDHGHMDHGMPGMGGDGPKCNMNVRAPILNSSIRDTC